MRQAEEEICVLMENEGHLESHVTWFQPCSLSLRYFTPLWKLFSRSSEKSPMESHDWARKTSGLECLMNGWSPGESFLGSQEWVQSANRNLLASHFSVISPVTNSVFYFGLDLFTVLVSLIGKLFLLFQGKVLLCHPGCSAVQAQLPGLKPSSCFSIPSSWDHKRQPLCPADFRIFL